MVIAKLLERETGMDALVSARSELGQWLRDYNYPARPSRLGAMHISGQKIDQVCHDPRLTCK